MSTAYGMEVYVFILCTAIDCKNSMLTTSTESHLSPGGFRGQVHAAV